MLKSVCRFVIKNVCQKTVHNDNREKLARYRVKTYIRTDVADGTDSSFACFMQFTPRKASGSAEFNPRMKAKARTSAR